MPKLWRWSIGQKAYNKVTVYERRPNGPLSIQWWDDNGRHNESLENVAGQPVHDKELAMLIARRSSDEQAKARERDSAAALFGIPARHTLKELLDALHEAKEEEWSEKYRKDQRRYKAFWLLALGKDIPLPLPPIALSEVVKKAAKAKKWGPRTRGAYIQYLKDAVSFAQMHLKWLGEADNLSALKLPKLDSQSLPYTKTEMHKMLAAAPSVDLRIAAFLHIAYDAQRRKGAIRTLSGKAYRREDVEGVMRGVVQMPGVTDKARKSGQVVLTESGAQILEALLATPEVQQSGRMFPGRRRGPGPIPSISYKRLDSLLRAVEEAAGVQHIEGRGLHGIKRRASTDAIKRGGIRRASKQSGTTEATLQRRYDQDELEDKAELADLLEAEKVLQNGKLQRRTL